MLTGNSAIEEHLSSGRFRAPVLSTEDKDKLTAHATLFHGGRASKNATFRGKR